ncbi:hypothetical protein [Massilia niabensis]|uniref:Uncharacterized protein n=1 Tax=Massilia niabensis TaxID=544910 RepID=A0ABW0L9D1_9BURK
MRPRSLILVALFCAAGASEATARIDCQRAHGGPCATPPAPPAPPASPAPPAPPGAHDMQHAVAPLPPMPAAPPAPAMPAMPPAPPAPPAPPPLPDIPEKAHAACAGKLAGSPVTITLGPGETMSGHCEREGGRMAFQLRSYRHL